LPAEQKAGMNCTAKSGCCLHGISADRVHSRLHMFALQQPFTDIVHSRLYMFSLSYILLAPSHYHMAVVIVFLTGQHAQQVEINADFVPPV